MALFEFLPQIWHNGQALWGYQEDWACFAPFWKMSVGYPLGNSRFENIPFSVQW